METEILVSYRRWFYAASTYNAVWGLAVLAFPTQIVAALGLKPLEYPVLFQVIGMMVGVYAYGYFLLARRPLRYSGLIWIGLAGKTFGPVGLLLAALQGRLPWSFGWLILINDLVWWPAFWSFGLRYGRRPLD